MSLSKKYRKEVSLFVKVCVRLAKNMYVTAYGGNLAWKLEDDVILITPTQKFHHGKSRFGDNDTR